MNDRLKQFGGMAMAIVAYVAVSQLGSIITSRIALSAYLLLAGATTFFKLGGITVVAAAGAAAATAVGAKSASRMLT